MGRTAPLHKPARNFSLAPVKVPVAQKVSALGAFYGYSAQLIARWCEVSLKTAELYYKDYPVRQRIF